MKNTGFIVPVVDSTQYVLGAGQVPQVILQTDGDWTALLPAPEQQNIRGFETYNCTAFGMTNAIELIMYRLYGQKVNYSDRWVSIISGTKAPGNDPHTVCEAIRKYGLIPEEMLPFSEDLKSIEEYNSFKGADKDACYQAGKDWLRKYTFKHEWCFDATQPLAEKVKNMETALRYSPLCLGVYAWATDQRKLYVKLGSENHWTTKYAQNQYSKIFDSYDPFLKVLDQEFTWCKRFHIEENVTPEQAGKFIEILKLLLQWLGLIEKQKSMPTTIPPVSVPVAPPQPQPEPIKPKYLWDTPENSRHSVRVICDDYFLNAIGKKVICAVIQAESGFNIKAKNVNKNGSTDWGICQINDHYWIGPTNYFKSVEEVLTVPEKSVRFMVEAYNQGHIDWWTAHKNGSYRKYL